MMRSVGRPKAGKGKSVACAVSVTMKATLAQSDGILQRLPIIPAVSLITVLPGKEKEPLFPG